MAKPLRLLIVGPLWFLSCVGFGFLVESVWGHILHPRLLLLAAIVPATLVAYAVYRRMGDM